MACQIFPILSDTTIKNLTSKAEAKFYRSCMNLLPSDFLVFHSLAIIDQNLKGGYSVGECDFVICDPNFGILTIEVKGGGIEYNPAIDSNWFSINDKSEKFKIKDPFKQSLTNKYRVKRIIEDLRIVKENSFSIFHAVAFPDISVQSLGKIISFDRPREMIACSEDLDELFNWYNKAINFWNGKKEVDPLGKQIVEEIKKKVLSPIIVNPSLDRYITTEEEERKVLTDTQLRLLLFLDNFTKANIEGGAGTGKTVLAIHLAVKNSNKGLKTLFLCFNRDLGHELNKKLRDIKNLTVGSFHSVMEFLTSNYFSECEKQAFADLGKEDYWNTIRPYAYTLAIEKIKTLIFECVIIDEAQDFSEDCWMTIETMLSEDSNFFIFSDTNQSFYSKKRIVPKLSQPFLLNNNCRNTKKIHKFAYNFYEGPAIHPPSIIGKNLSIIKKTFFKDQIDEIYIILNKLIYEEKINKSKIAILVANSDTFSTKLSGLEENKKTKNFIKSSELSKENELIFTTIKKFKGLEKEIIIIWGLNEVNDYEKKELTYVGVSRAKSVCYLIN